MILGGRWLWLPQREKEKTMNNREPRVPENTTRRVQEDPLGFLAAAMVMGSSNAIEHQERSGQQGFVHSDTLPADMREGCREALEKLGAKFGDPVKGDSLFIACTLPEGWTKQGTDHAMWSKLIDDKGRERGSIFYKAAFYDRSAHMDLKRRYRLSRDYEVRDGVIYHACDGDAVIRTFDKIMFSARSWEALEEAVKVAKAWMGDKFPAWEDPAAYWDDPAYSTQA